MTQIKVTDWALRTLVTATFFAYFVAPRQLMLPLVALCFAAVGIWFLVYPEGVLGWAKTPYPIIDVNDSSLWWAPRLIGAFFIFLPLILALGFRVRR